MLYQVIEDGEITQSYSMPDHDDSHHLVTGGERQSCINVIPVPSMTLTGSYFTILVDATGGAKTINLPAAASHTYRIYNIKKIDASGNAVTIDGAGAETIDGAATQVIAAQYDSYTIQSDGTEWWII